MRIWGFDLGTTSVGFAVIDYNEDSEAGSIIHLGSRIFPEGVTEDKGEPRNKQRRAKRMMRRQLRRKRWRRRAMHESLAEAGLLPAAHPATWSDELSKTDPYELRTRGLSEKLAPHEVGRALFHMLKRRGFKSARLAEAETADADKRKEDEGIKAEIKGIAAEMQGRTLGQWLHGQERRRRHHTGRDMTETEFNTFWQAQAPHHPALMTDSLHRALYETGFKQRPIFWRLKTLGTCSLEPDAPLCAKGSWLGQRFIMLQMLNHLRLAGGNARPLLPEERAALLPVLETNPGLSFGAVRKLLKPIWQRNGTSLRSRFNLEADGNEKGLLGNATEAALIKTFGMDWAGHPKRGEIRDEISDRLWAVNYRQIGNKRVEIRGDAGVTAARADFIQHAKTAWGLSGAQAAALAEIEPPPAWLGLSAVAIAKLMPHLEAGLSYREACDRAYPEHAKPAGVESRLSTEPTQFDHLRNPVVKRCLTELRKVVNNLIDAYGKPDRIRIELARDVALAGKSRKNYVETLRKREALRRRAAKELKQALKREPKDRDIAKWLLWQECGETCPYTLDRIGFGDLFGDHPKYDIEHIWPRSLVLEDAQANKTLCRRDVNLRKGQRTPFELFNDAGHGIRDLPSWEEVRDHIKSLVDEGRMPDNKARRFTREKPLSQEDRSDERLIGDTAYIAREARAWLAKLMPNGVFQVEPRNGRLVSTLRKIWHVNELLSTDGEKNRNDHRHHALDAAICALFGTRAMQQLIAWYKAKEDNPEARPPSVAQPWPKLREDLGTALDRIIVSHRVRRKVNGQLHDETRLGLTEIPGTSDGGKTYSFFVKRKALAAMSKTEIAAIRDDAVRRLAETRLAEFDGDTKAAFSKPLELPDKNAPSGFRKVEKARLLVKLQPSLAVRLNDGKAYAEAGDNHHMALYRRADGKILFRTVSRIEAARRVARRQPVVEPIGPDGAALVFSLTPGSMLRIPNDAGGYDYRVVTSVWDAGPIVLVDHREAGGAVWKRPTGASLIAMGAQKVNIDPIGRVRPAND